MNHQRSWKKWWLWGVSLLALTAVWGLQAAPLANVDVDNIARLSLGTGGIQADEASFFSYLSNDNRYATFHSWATNFAPDQDGENWLDVFYRDLETNTTRKITNGIDGPTNEDSFDAVLTADGRYIVYTSYAWNLVPNDTNRDAWSRNGLDVFLYDTVTQQTQRVSLTHQGTQIIGNSSGVITPDGKYILMASNGPGILPNSTPSGSNLYLRDWRTGDIRLLVDIDGGHVFTSFWPSYDGRYVTFSTTYPFLVPGDTNGQQDVFLLDTQTMRLTLISRGYQGGVGDAVSGQSHISQDGRYVIFQSAASNLVPNDTNNARDVFVYDRLTGGLERVSVASSGAQSNGDSRDPSICGDGSVVSFSSDATNLISGDNNGKRDAFVHNRITGETIVATINSSGGLTNGKTHRSYLTHDCEYITYATDGDNIVSGDTNDARDLFIARVVRPADLSRSVTTLSLTEPGETTYFRAYLRNTGNQPTSAALTIPLPAHTVLDEGSLPAGASYNIAQNQVEWQGDVIGDSEVEILFALTVDAGQVDYTVIRTTPLLSWGASTQELFAVTAVNGLHTYLPQILHP